MKPEEKKGKRPSEETDWLEKVAPASSDLSADDPSGGAIPEEPIADEPDGSGEPEENLPDHPAPLLSRIAAFFRRRPAEDLSEPEPLPDEDAPDEDENIDEDEDPDASPADEEETLLRALREREKEAGLASAAALSAGPTDNEPAEPPTEPTPTGETPAVSASAETDAPVAPAPADAPSPEETGSAAPSPDKGSSPEAPETAGTAPSKASEAPKIPGVSETAEALTAPEASESPTEPDSPAPAGEETASEPTEAAGTAETAVSEPAGEAKEDEDPASGGEGLLLPPPESVTVARPLASLRTSDTVNSLFLDVIIALLPLFAWAVYLYGFRPLVLAGIAVAVCLILETPCRLIFRRGAPFDLSPVVTGLLLTLCLPPTVPLWIPALGAAVAALLRQLFGGIGRNLVNPAATAVAVLYILFPGLMTAFCETGVRLAPFAVTVGSYPTVGTTALASLLSGTLPSQSIGSMLVGLRPGLIGEPMALLLIAGGLYLAFRRVIRLGPPAVFLIVSAALFYFFPTLSAASDLVALRYAVYQLLCGNLLLGVFFMATDPVTTPRNPRAALIAAAAGGAVTVAVRYFVAPEISVICAILVINLLSKPLDLLFTPTPFGGKRKKT